MSEFLFRFDWMPVLSEEANRYLFPDPISSFFKSQYSGPAVYRWAVRQGSDLKMVYYGEAENLARRIDGYRRGHEGQKTNARIKALFLSLDKDLIIALETLQFEPFSINGVEISQKSLGKKDVRCFLENALIVMLPNGIQLLNRATSLEVKQKDKALEILEKLSPADRQIVVNQFLGQAKK